MTKITVYNKGIIIDGHADTKEECETITLLCDSLPKTVILNKLSTTKVMLRLKK